MIMDSLIEKIDRFSKAKDALRTIGEVAELISVEQHVIRFWESKFSQIKPYKNRGIRYYTLQDIELLSRIRAHLYDDGYTIKGVQQLLAKNPDKIIAPSQERSDSLDSVLVPRAQLAMILDQLNSVRSKLV